RSKYCTVYDLPSSAFFSIIGSLIGKPKTGRPPPCFQNWRNGPMSVCWVSAKYMPEKGGGPGVGVCVCKLVFTVPVGGRVGVGVGGGVGVGLGFGGGVGASGVGK